MSSEKSQPGQSASDLPVWSQLIEQSRRIGRLEADNVSTKAAIEKILGRGSLYLGPKEWIKVGAGLAFLAVILWDRSPGLAKIAAKLAGVPAGLTGF